MGFQPKKQNDKKEQNNKAYDVNMVFKSEEAYNIAKEISVHKHILLLRKSAGKLSQFMDCFITTKYPAQRLIEIKYHFSQCRSEVLAMMEGMANDPKRFKFKPTFSDEHKILEDTLNGISFAYYQYDTYKALYINGKEFLTKIELECMGSVINSMYIMHENEYKLQQELEILEEQKIVFETYQSEKLSSR